MSDAGIWVASAALFAREHALREAVGRESDRHDQVEPMSRPHIPPGSSETARVNDDFKILFEFFERHRQEVAGRDVATVPPDLREKLARFAEGRCSEEERAEMKQLLFEKPELIPLLVTETVALRQAQR